MRAASPGIKALALFFVFGTMMSGLTGFLLLFPGTPLDAAWRLNPTARIHFHVLGSWAILLMTAVCLACSTAAIGLWQVRRWGYHTAIAILVINIVGDGVNFALMQDMRTLIGLPIGGAMITFLVSRRSQFACSEKMGSPRR